MRAKKKKNEKSAKRQLPSQTQNKKKRACFSTFVRDALVIPNP
jgi:hypothetical protein